MKPHDEARIRKAVRQQIAMALQDDLNGGETLMKEVWEECRNSDELLIAKDELRQIILRIEGGAPMLRALIAGIDEYPALAAEFAAKLAAKREKS